jgi:tRNA(Ile)-lysidine synthetase-like protein
VECEGNTSVNILLSELKDGGNFALPVGKLTLTLLKDSEINLSEQAKCKKSNANIYEVICRVPDSIEVLTIKYREGGEKIYLHQDHSASLKKLYQSNKILPWLRDKLPLIYSKDELLCSLAGFTAYLCQLDADVSANIATRLIRFRYEMS